MVSNRLSSIGVLFCIIGGAFYLREHVLLLSHTATQNDFKHLYLAGFLAARGADFFDITRMMHAKTLLNVPGGINPFVYPPFFAILLIPLSYLSYNAAWWVFTFLSHAAYFASLAFIIRLLRRDDEPLACWWGFLLTLSAAFFPLMKSYSAGQMNTFMLLAITWAAWEASRRRDLRVGVILGLGAAVKIAPGFLLLYFAWKRRWTAVYSGAAVLVFTGLFSLAFLGWGVHASFLNELPQMGYGSSTWAEYGMRYHVEPHNQAPAALWYRLLTHNPETQGVINAPGLAKSLSYLTAFSILGFLLWITPRRSKNIDSIDFALWTLAMLLLPSLMWDHYCVQALLAIAVTARILISGSPRGTVLLGVAMFFVLTPYLYDRFDFPTGLRWLDSQGFRSGWMTLLMPIKLYGLLLLGAFLIINRRYQVETDSISDSSEESNRLF